MTQMTSNEEKMVRDGGTCISCGKTMWVPFNQMAGMIHEECKNKSSNEEKIFASQEANYCDFCGELKPVERYYLRVKNKHFDDNKKGKYATYISYCQQCGVEDSLLHSQKERVVEMCEEMKKERFSWDYKEGDGEYKDGYNEALSDLKTKIEEL